MAIRQATFDDLQKEESTRSFVQNLTPKQLDIITFLGEGLYQSYVAKRLKISRAYVNITVSDLLKHQLIKQQTFSPLQKKSLTYELTEKLKSLLNQSKSLPSSYTLCIPHHIKFKYPVQAIKNELNKDGWKFSKSRSIFIKSWEPKGREALLYHVNVGDNTIGVEYHGKSLVAYRIEHKEVMAQTVEEATHIIAQEIGKGVEIFVREQSAQNCMVSLGQPILITEPHYAFESEIVKKVIASGQQAQLNLAGTGISVDLSPERNGVLGIGHVETKNPVLANKVDLGLRNAIDLKGIVQREIGSAMPKAMDEFNKALDPLTGNLMRIEALIQGGTTIQNQYQQMIHLLTRTLDEMALIREENANLKKKMETLGGTNV